MAGPADESAAGAGTPLSASLYAGLESLSLDQKITFTKYVKVVLPFDGFIFWVKADQLSASALYNASVQNSFGFDQAPAIITPAATVEVQGSLHFSTVQQQDADSVYTINRMVFTSETEIQDFNEIGAVVMFVATFRGVQFAFNSRGMFYEQAGLHHYQGDAVYSFMKTQLVDDARTFDSANLVLSNSMPAWLTLNRLMPIYPSFLSPGNLRPPYATVFIPESGTTPLQAFPYINIDSSHWQLARDEVTITIWGLRNFNALDWMDYVIEWFTLNDDIMGLMNMPIIRDAQRVQTELGVIAQKKTVQFVVSYYQTRINALARQLLLRAFVHYEPTDGVVVPPSGIELQDAEGFWQFQDGSVVQWG